LRDPLWGFNRINAPKKLNVENPETGTGSGRREVSGISYNGYIISMLSYTNSCLASHVWARGITKKDISMLGLQFLS
jgi:hypothetical protein